MLEYLGTLISVVFAILLKLADVYQKLSKNIGKNIFSLQKSHQY